MSRKELKEAYKNIKFPMGVFQIRNTANGKIYVESSPNLDKIWNRHRVQLEMGSHLNLGLQRDWNELGPSYFVFEILAEIEPKEGHDQENRREIKLLEKMYMEELQPYDEKGYHLRPVVR